MTFTAQPLRHPMPFIPWCQAGPKLRAAWRPGDHVTILGPNGSGKTVLAREMAEWRLYAMWFVIKTRDPELEKLRRRGWHVTRDKVPDPEPGKPARWVVWPRAVGIRATRSAQRRVFFDRIDQVHQTGGWTIVADELTYLTDDLGLISDMRTVLRTLRSDNVSALLCAQRPRRIPVEALTESTFVCVFRSADKYDRDRLSELGAAMSPRELGAAIASLPLFHFLVIDRRSGEVWQTRVDR